MTNVDLFPGDVTDVTPSPYTGSLSFVGSASTHPWADDVIDSTEAVLGTSWNGSDFDIFTRVKAPLPTLAGTPTSLVAHMWAYTVTSFGADRGAAHLNVALMGSSGSPYVAVADESPVFQHWPVEVDALPREYTIDLGSPTDLYSTWGTTQAAIVASLQSGVLWFQVQVDVHTGHVPWGFDVHIAALWLEAVGVTTESPVVALMPAARVGAPTLRQYPRSDGLGASSAPRMYPPTPSVQASNRRAGGYL